jgi:hypothetical protein
MHLRDIIDCEALGNPSRRRARAGSLRIIGLRCGSGSRFAIQEPHLPKVLASVGPERGAPQRLNGPTAGPRIVPRGPEKGESAGVRAALAAAPMTFLAAVML